MNGDGDLQQYLLNLAGLGRQQAFQNPTPEGASTGSGLIGIGVTALAALSLVQGGVPVPLIYTELYPTGRPR